ncbi:MAG: translation elongation factor Ts [Gammaproteobacteria bacterium]|nr:translation elongation factor Ts [Gammaproteobacteria bacterium]
MAITASMVKELRDRTGAGMMECKNALTEADGDMDAAIEALRKKGAAKADKKAGRIAAEGVVLSALGGDGATGVLVEVNCETDFVAKDDNFQAFARAVAATVLEAQPADVEALSGLKLSGGGQTVEEARVDLINKIGEKISVRRFQILDAPDGARIGAYTHGTRIGVLVAVEGGRDDLGKDLAMHIAASQPQFIEPDEVPQETLDAEKEIFAAQARESGKPDNIVEKMVQGRLQKYLNEITLLGQPYVKDPDQTVAKLLKAEQARVLAFHRLEVGQGIEKREDDFVSEVMAQAQGE